MAEGADVIRNGGSGAIRAAALRAAAAEIAILVTAGAVPRDGADLQSWLPAYFVLAALAVAAGAILVRSFVEHGRTASEIECTDIVMLARNRRGQLLALSWQEITAVIPARTRLPLLGAPLTDLNISVRFRKNEVLENLSQEAAHRLLQVYNLRARGSSPEEARKAADGWFDIRRY